MNDAHRRALLLTCSLLAACGAPSTAGTEPSGGETQALPLTAPPPEQRASEPEAERLCLPVVSEECGCSYECSAGTLVPGTEPRAYEVHNDFWSTPLRATVSSWCVGDHCTPAFHAELVCDGICERRPADATCAFRGGRCSTGRESAALDGAYQVRWRRGGPVAGVVSLSEGHYHWVGRGPTADEPQRTFAFVSHPHGEYRVTMRVPAVGLRPEDLPHGTTLAVVDFAPDDGSIQERERSVEVRNDRERGVRYFHSVVSELESWQAETLPAQPRR